MTEFEQEAMWREDEERLVRDRSYFGLCWPNHCTKCGGWGAFSWTEHHDRGFPGELMSEPCECVQEEGVYEVEAIGGSPDASVFGCKCARCGHFGLNEQGEGPCIVCGWDYDDGIPEL